MENRFGLKDFFLLLLLFVVIVVLLLGMKQYDRQWTLMSQLLNQQKLQTQSLAETQRAMTRLLAAGVPTASRPAIANGPTMQGEDPFARVEAAQAMPGYARGDWLVDAISNTDKITPLVSGDADASDIQARVLETLITRDPVTLNWQPLLASNVPKSSDGLTFVFKMRPGVTFSDGEPLTADDVVWTYNWIMNPAVATPRFRSSFDKVASCVQTGPDEVTFKFKEPFFQSLEVAGGFGIMPRHFYEKYSPDDFNKSTGLLMGSGPFRMSDPTGWSPGKPVELVRNERYWGAAPAFDKLVDKVITNDLARLTAFQNGEIDEFGAQPEQYRKMLQDPALLARTQRFEYQSAVAGYRYIAWNEQRDGKPTRFADKRVRQAMSMLTDVQRICDQVMLGYATPVSGPFNPSSKQNDPAVKPWPFDVNAAKQLLQQAGYTPDADGVLRGPDGQPFAFRLTYPTGASNYEQIALFLKDTYAQAGIQMDPDPLDWSVFSDRLKNHTFDAISLGWTAGIEDDIYQMFDTSQIADGGDNFCSYSSPALDAAMHAARSETDEAKRMPLWRTCHDILHDEQPYTFMFTRKTLAFMDKRIANVQHLPLGLNDATEWFVPTGQQKWSK